MLTEILEPDAHLDRGPMPPDAVKARIHTLLESDTLSALEETELVALSVAWRGIRRAKRAQATPKRYAGVNPARHTPYACVLCERVIGARAFHAVLTRRSGLPPKSAPEEREAEAGPIVCGRCSERADAHRRLFPDCPAVDYCDLYDHAHVLCADRAAAAAWFAARDNKPTSETE